MVRYCLRALFRLKSILLVHVEGYVFACAWSFGEQGFCGVYIFAFLGVGNGSIWNCENGFFIIIIIFDQIPVIRHFY